MPSPFTRAVGPRGEPLAGGPERGRLLGPRAVWLWARVAVVAVALALLARHIVWSEVWRDVRDASPALLLVVVVLNAAMMIAGAARLRLLLAPRHATLATCLRAIVSASAINNVLPLRGGDVARLWMLEQTAGVPKAAGITVTLVERLTEIAALGLLALPAAVMVPEQRWATPGAVSVVGAGAILLMGMWAINRPRAESPAKKRPATALKAKLGRLTHLVVGGVPSLSSAPALARVMALAFASWLIEIAMVVTCASALHFHISCSLAVILLLAVNLALAVPSTPGNVGPFEAASAVVLLAAGYARSQAVAFALIYHVVQVLPVTLVGLAVATRAYHRGMVPPIDLARATPSPGSRSESSLPEAGDAIGDPPGRLTN